MLHLVIALQNMGSDILRDLAGFFGSHGCLLDAVGYFADVGGKLFYRIILLQGSLGKCLRAVGNVSGTFRHLIGGNVDLPHGVV